jgi:hypothetical protein
MADEEESGDAEARPARTVAIIDDHRTSRPVADRPVGRARPDRVGVAYDIDEGLELVGTRPTWS